MPAKWDSITIEPNRFRDSTSKWEWSVYGHGTYEEWSVLAGQERRAFLDGFATIEEAKEAYPDAEVLGHTSYVEHKMPDVPPDWFDPDYAGETW